MIPRFPEWNEAVRRLRAAHIIGWCWRCSTYGNKRLVRDPMGNVSDEWCFLCRKCSGDRQRLMARYGKLGKSLTPDRRAEPIRGRDDD